MKYWTILCLLTLVCTTGSAVHAQTLEESIEAYRRQDYVAAAADLRSLSNQGNAKAQQILGGMYESGKGVPKDLQQALRWYRKSADQGYASAQFSLGLRYQNGDGVPKDAKQAMLWYSKAASQGNGYAQVNLGVIYENGRGVPQDLEKAVSLYRKAAEQELALAQLFLGNMYARGHGLPKDDQQAVLWYRKAAEQGDDVAQNNLATQYATGQGVLKDDKQATYWFRKAADQGLATAQATLGSRYLYGSGVVKDEREAALWFHKAAEQDDVGAQHNLGYLYFNGKGVVKDHRVAFQWYKKAAEQGLNDAQFELGALYASGDGVAKDDQQALMWYRKAAEQGYAAAQGNLASMYADGQGVPKDEQRAYFWWLLASAQSGERGASLAAEYRDAVEKRLKPEQRSSAQAAARNWKPGTGAPPSTPSYASAGEEGGLKSAPSRLSPTSVQANATGSGFRVARGTIVTNHHVIDGCSRLRVNGVAAQVGGSDARSDLALLRATLAGLSTSLRAQRAAVGEPVAVAGYPLHGLLSGFNMTTGSLSSLSGMGGDTRLVQITAPVQPGNSGGPVLDSAGNLMGVVVSKLDAIKAAKLTGDIPQNVNFAINANVLRSFLDANSVEYETASSDKAIASTAIAEKAKGFTVLVECWK